MLITVVSYLVAAAAGFGIGRIKNAAKIAAAKAEVAKFEASATADAKSAIAAIKAKL